MCGGGHISWQVRYFVRVRRVDVYIFVAGAGNREVAIVSGSQRASRAGSHLVNAGHFPFNVFKLKYGAGNAEVEGPS